MYQLGTMINQLFTENTHNHIKKEGEAAFEKSDHLLNYT